MSSQPHTVLPWAVRRTVLPPLSLRCVDFRLLDPLLARGDHVTLDWTRAWRLDTSSALIDQAWPVQVEVAFEAPVPVRPERLIAQRLDRSRTEVRRRIKCAVPLRRTTNTGFPFTVPARSRQRGGRRRA